MDCEWLRGAELVRSDPFRCANVPRRHWEMSKRSSRCSVTVILGHNTTSAHALALTHTPPAPVYPPHKKTPLSLFAQRCERRTRAAHTVAFPDNNQTLMKTSKTLPRPSSGTHNVLNHMLLLTGKCSLLIGSFVKKKRKRKTEPCSKRVTEMSRCSVLSL